MFYTVSLAYYWLHVAVNIGVITQNSYSCARSIVNLRNRLNWPKFVPANQSLEGMAVDILGLLPRTRSIKRFLLAITDCFTKLTQVTAPAESVAA